MGVLMIRLQIILNSAEGAALTRLANQELREPRDQIRLIVRRELERRGLLVSQTQSAEQGAKDGDDK